MLCRQERETRQRETKRYRGQSLIAQTVLAQTSFSASGLGIGFAVGLQQSNCSSGSVKNVSEGKSDGESTPDRKQLFYKSNGATHRSL